MKNTTTQIPGGPRLRLILCLYLVALALAFAGALLAQDIGSSSRREFWRAVKLTAPRTDQLNTIWEILDAKKTNTTLLRVILTRDGTNDVIVTVNESVRVKLVED